MEKPTSYPHRLEGRHIRVLELKPGSAADPLQARLVEVDLDAAGPFEALSYVWGDPRRSLRLRRGAETRLIWADAICINQEDLDECPQQVQLMRDVYSCAERVVVWLGEGGDQSVDLAVSLMGAIYAACEGSAKTAGVDLHAHAVSSRPFEDVALSTLQGDVASLVQETVLARSSKVYVGSLSLPWLTVGVVASWLNTMDILADFNTTPELKDIPYYEAYCMFDTEDVDEANLTQTLKKYRDLKATDPRDKVYGVLGLVNPAADPHVRMIEVDYRRELWEVYGDVVKSTIARTGDLSVLSLVKHVIEFDDNDLFPSWIPRWDSATHVTVMYDEWLEGVWKANGDEHPLGRFNITPSGEVTLKGLEFDTVEWVTGPMDVDEFGDLPPATEHPFVKIWDKCSQGSEDPILLIITLADVLTANLSENWVLLDSLEDDERQQIHGDFVAYLNHLLASSGRQDLLVQPSPGEDDWKRYKLIASRVCDQRRFFVTKRGYHGLGSGSAREGDVLSVLAGGPMLYILRRIEGRFRFLGEAYVDNLMQGEAWQEKDIQHTWTGITLF
ncbi:uncharacterized protein E0L32_000424 [Thyridium curvatum]|uniref:Heterokaryon incompatibility domain-containing protein n=1 Tax=Thyridium curvatum TaxID=1093900 RepID=A0A507BBP2_9PEZI|nr:uncharacterized protein E0L32_000424 [Thyridium curvatum]TPX14030.1 hypothetical protein E0L32_000424 [Thyridium curvatum]